MIGQTLGGYEIVELIGAGGMAEVYMAYEYSVDRYVAIKVLLKRYSSDEDFRALFDREARLIAKLEHAHILPLYAYGEQDGLLYLVMRYYRSGSLASLIEQEGPLPLEEVNRLLKQMASALDYAHERDILHRDIKTENVLLSSNGDAYLGDFGLAKMASAEASSLTGNFVVGTPAFMSPEQCLGEENLTPASDQYSLGIVLFNMITGQMPFTAESPLKVIHRQIRQPPPSLCKLRPDLPELAEQVVQRALAKKPTERFADCQTLSDAFDQALAGRGLRQIRGPLRKRIDSVLADLQLSDDDEE